MFELPNQDCQDYPKPIVDHQRAREEARVLMRVCNGPRIDSLYRRWMLCESDRE